MSSAGGEGGGGGGGAAPQQYFCYQCEQTVSITPTSSELVCPNCNGGFLEESDTVPPPNPNPNPNLDSPFPDNFPSAAAFGGLPFIFSGNQPGEIDLSALFGSGPTAQFANPPRSPDEFNPFHFLHNYFNTMRAGGANIQLVFDNSGGVGGGAGEFRLPSNLGDYFIGPGLEQLIQQLAENDPNRYGTPPAAKSAVEGLPDVKITEGLLGSDSSQCAVCKDSFELNEEAKQMPCKHIYHKDCILPWLEMHNSCPVCRYELPTDDPDYESRRTGQQNSDDNNSNRNTNSGNDNYDASGGGGGGFNLGFGNQENASNQQMPRTVERRFRISLPPWLFGFGSPAETSNSGGGGGGAGNNNDGGNSGNTGNNNGGSGGSNTGSGGGGQARQEDLD